MGSPRRIPTGFRPSAQLLRGTSYLGLSCVEILNRNAVVAIMHLTAQSRTEARRWSTFPFFNENPKIFQSPVPPLPKIHQSITNSRTRAIWLAPEGAKDISRALPRSPALWWPIRHGPRLPPATAPQKSHLICRPPAGGWPTNESLPRPPVLFAARQVAVGEVCISSWCLF